MSTSLSSATDSSVGASFLTMSWDPNSRQHDGATQSRKAVVSVCQCGASIRRDDMKRHKTWACPLKKVQGRTRPPLSCLNCYSPISRPDALRRHMKSNKCKGFRALAPLGQPSLKGPSTGFKPSNFVRGFSGPAPGSTSTAFSSASPPMPCLPLTPLSVSPPPEAQYVPQALQSAPLTLAAGNDWTGYYLDLYGTFDPYLQHAQQVPSTAPPYFYPASITFGNSYSTFQYGCHTAPGPLQAADTDIVQHSIQYPLPYSVATRVQTTAMLEAGLANLGLPNLEADYFLTH